MSWSNYDDVMSQLQSAGLVIDKQLSLDARIQRWKVEGEDNEKRGWSRLKDWTSKAGHTYIVGDFGVWHSNDDGRTRVELPRRDDQTAPLTAEDIAAIKAAQKEAARKLAEERKREAKIAAGWAATVWSKCPPCEQHEYLTRKQIQPNGARLMVGTDGMKFTGLDDSNFYRLSQAEGALVVPMHDESGNVCGIQFIYPKGHARAKKIERDKEFWPSGMAMGGTFGLIGPIRRNGVLLIAEGFATAASLFEATGQSVAYAFSANNLVKAGKLIRKKNPRLKLLFCADDDYLTKDAAGNLINPGVTAAANATAEIELSAWVKPDFTDADGNDLRGGKKLTDFNDLALLTGLPLTLANQINARLDELGWRDAVSARVEPPPQGEGEGGRRLAVSIMALDDIVERFIFIDDETGDFVFDTWERNVCKYSKVIRLLPAGGRADDIKRHPIWPTRAVYIDQIGFDPGSEDANIACNRWNGWPTVPKAGSCVALLSLLEYLCSGEQNHRELYHWILKWLAYPIQHPGAKLHSALVVHGPQGTGKSRFFEAYAKIYGEYSIILNQGAIEDKFNADWAERKLYVLADEIVANTEKYHLKNQLKNLITGDWVRVNPKNVAAHKERNHMNMTFLSNEKQPVILDNDDRRHCVIYTPEKLEDKFYNEVTEEIEAGGIAALHQYLLDLDIGDFKPWSKPPMTEAKRDLIAISLGSDDSFIREWMGGEIEALPFCPSGTAQVYAEYLRWCRREGETRPRRSKEFWSTIAKIGWFRGVRDRHTSFKGDKTISWKCVIPSEQALSSAATRPHSKDYRKRPEQTQTEWLTECFFAIEDAKRAAGIEDDGP